MATLRIMTLSQSVNERHKHFQCKGESIGITNTNKWTLMHSGVIVYVNFSTWSSLCLWVCLNKLLSKLSKQQLLQSLSPLGILSFLCYWRFLFFILFYLFFFTLCTLHVNKQRNKQRDRQTEANPQVNKDIKCPSGDCPLSDA